jgi:opacity protein-like surface antigen
VAALGALALACAAPAKAADVYAGGLKDTVYVPMPTWTGFYVGAHVGGAWSNFDINRNFFFDDIPNAVTGIRPDNNFFGIPFGENNLNGTGAFGGAQFGYNFQGGSNCCFVYGIEVDIGGLDNGGKNRDFFVDGIHPFIGNLNGTAIAAPGFAPQLLLRARNNGGDFYGDVTGRVGYTFGNALVYAKGGFAWLNSDIRLSEVVTVGPFAFPLNGNNDGNNTLTGWTIGGGLEYLFGTNWSVKVEYLHFDFGNIDRHCCNDFFFNDFHIHNNFTVDTVKVGVNYHITPAPVVLPYK